MNTHCGPIRVEIQPGVEWITSNNVQVNCTCVEENSELAKFWKPENEKGNH